MELDQVVGDLRDQCEQPHPQAVAHPVPGVEEALHHQKAEDGKGRPAQHIAQVLGLHDAPQG